MDLSNGKSPPQIVNIHLIALWRAHTTDTHFPDRAARNAGKFWENVVYCMRKYSFRK
jgi:hypothetical protein